MKIYFACSITGGREFEPVYQLIVQGLQENGHSVLTAHLAGSGAIADEAALFPEAVYTRDVAWIRDCDVLIAEVSVPSHGVGYEIAFALGLGKKVLAIAQHDRKVSKMITGNPDTKLTNGTYQSPQQAIQLTLEFLQVAK